MKTLNENQKDILGTAVALTLFLIFIGYFTATQPDYTHTNQTEEVKPEHVQSPTLEKYGQLFIKNLKK